MERLAWADPNNYYNLDDILADAEVRRTDERWTETTRQGAERGIQIGPDRQAAASDAASALTGPISAPAVPMRRARCSLPSLSRVVFPPVLCPVQVLPCIFPNEATDLGFLDEQGMDEQNVTKQQHNTADPQRNTQELHQ